MFEKYFSGMPKAEDIELPGTPEEHIAKVIGTMNAKGLEANEETAEAVRVGLYKLYGREREEVLEWVVSPEKAETEDELAKINDAHAFFDKMETLYPDELIEKEIKALQ